MVESSVGGCFDQDYFGEALSTKRSRLVLEAEGLLPFEFDSEQKRALNEGIRNLQVINGAVGAGKTSCLRMLALHVSLSN